ncbi:MAG: S-layer homology domain-containing protein, partial [Oscillospiraceae bacterium]|nr:S-layer homology domain-containing protein [Oscillospiraceae bacterium]
THVAAGVSTASAAAVVRATAERGVGKPKLTDLTDAFLNAYGEDLTDAAARNAAVTSYAADSRVYFRSALTSYRLASLGADVRAYELTYDVTPHIDTEITQNGAQSDATQKIANASVQNPMTIQLPVPDLFATTRVLVYHDGTKLDGDYEVQGEAGSRYVEVESSSFSSFTITALYRVTWKSQDGSRTLAVTEDLPYGTVPSYGGSTPTREADAQYRYSFAGWASTTAQTSGTAASSLPGVTEDATYYAAFTPTTRSYTITWKNHDGTVIKTTDAPYGSMPLYDGSTPLRTDPGGEYTYTFSGWTPALATVTEDAAYTACFNQKLTGYEITLSDTGSAYDGTPKTPAVTVEKDGKTLSPDDYTVSYDNNVDAGVNTAVVTVTLDGGKTITETFTIARRTLTVTAEDKTVTYGDAAPDYTLRYDGFAPGESAANLSTPPKAYCPYAPYDAAGSYEITPSGGAAANYTFVYEPGTLAVNRALSNAVSVALDDWVYGGAPCVPSSTADFGRATTVYTYYTDPACTQTTTADDGAETDGAQPTDAGTYYLQASVPATADYVGGSAVDEFTIAKAPIAPTVSVQSWLVGTPPVAPTVDGNPGDGAVTIEYKPKGAPDSSYSTTVPAAAETYTVRATVAETDNYQAGVATADFTIQLYQVVFVDYDGTELSRSGHNYGDAVSTVTVPPDPTRASETVLDDDGNPVGTVTYTFAGWNPRVNGAATITKHLIYTATYTAYNSVTHDSTTVRGSSEIDVDEEVNADNNVVTTTETSTSTTTTTNGDTTELIRSTTVTTTETDNAGHTVSEESETKTAILIATNDERDESVTPVQSTDAYLDPGANTTTAANRVRAETVTTGNSIRSVTLDEVTANQILSGLIADNPNAKYIRGEIYLQSTLMEYTLASEEDGVTAVKLVYDVKPFLRVTVDNAVLPSVRLPDSAIHSMTFRLPIPGNFSSLKYVKVVHDSDSPSVYSPETQRASVRQDATGQHNVELTVTHFSLFTITALYGITYNLAGGSADNPTGYTIESPDITLHNPTRAGFSFSGWTGTDLTEATSPVTIPSGSAGDRVYTATWTPLAPSGGGGGGGAVVLQYAVVLDPPVIGEITSDHAFSPEGETVILAPRAPGRTPESVSVTDAYGNPVPVTPNEDGTFRFTMPASTVSVSVTFALTPAAPSISGVDRYLNTDDHIIFIRGYPDGSVRPRGNISRAETAMMLYRLLKDQDVPITKSFRDVPKRAWYREAVLKLASLGIVTGYRDGTFRPNEAIAREEFTTMVSRFAHATGGEIRFKDVRSGYWAEPYIRSAASYGWIQGYADANFCPKNPITRAEAAAVINRMLARSADLDYAAAHEDQLIHFTDLARNRWYYADMLEATNEHTHVYKDDKEHWTAITN